MRAVFLHGALSALALLCFGCIDLEGAYDQCVGSGRCGAMGAGSGDSGAADAGADAGSTVADAGSTADAASIADAGSTAPDAGLIVPDAGPSDAGPVGPDAGAADAGSKDAGAAPADAGLADAGPIDAGKVDAGSGAVDAGAPDASSYDGGPRCGSSANPKLRCDAPITLGTGSGINASALSAADRGFIAAWVGATVEVREVHLDGTATALVTGKPATQAQIAVDAKGSRWAVAWADKGAATAQCATSASGAGAPTTVSAGGAIRALSVATSADGAVALAAVTTSGSFVGEQASAACPASLQALRSDPINSGAVVSTSAGGGGFRYVWTDQFNAYNGSLSVMSRAAAGGTPEVFAPLSLHAPEDIAAVASTAGTTVLAAFSEVNTEDAYELGLYGTSADLTGDGAPATVSSTDPGSFALGTCGEGCVAAGVIAYDTGGPAVISFFSDDPQIRPRGAWDAVCSLQAQSASGSSIAVSSYGQRLGVLITTASAAKLYLCDIPPLP